jgi:hypothetical protein
VACGVLPSTLRIHTRSLTKHGLLQVHILGRYAFESSKAYKDPSGAPVRATQHFSDERQGTSDKGIVCNQA